jgi:hypothetical protein
MVYLQTPARYAAFNNATVDTPRLFGIPDKLIDRQLPPRFACANGLPLSREIVSAASGAIATISRATACRISARCQARVFAKAPVPARHYAAHPEYRFLPPP